MDYKYKEFKWLANMDGFNYPVDISYGTIYLGTVVVQSDGINIELVDTPTGPQMIKKTPNNKFKTLDIAGRVLHRTWKAFRHGGDDSQELVPKE